MPDRKVDPMREILAEEFAKVDAPAHVVAALRNPWMEDDDQSASSIGALAAMRRAFDAGRQDAMHEMDAAGFRQVS